MSLAFPQESQVLRRSKFRVMSELFRGRVTRVSDFCRSQFKIGLKIRHKIGNIAKDTILLLRP